MDQMTLHDFIRDWRVVSGAVATSIASLIGLASILAKVLPAGWRITKLLTWLSVNGSKAEQEVKAAQQEVQSAPTKLNVPPAAVLLLCLVSLSAAALPRPDLSHLKKGSNAERAETSPAKPPPHHPVKHPKAKDTEHGS